MKAALVLIAALLLILLIKYASSYAVYVSGNAGKIREDREAIA